MGKQNAGGNLGRLPFALSHILEHLITVIKCSADTVAKVLQKGDEAGVLRVLYKGDEVRDNTHLGTSLLSVVTAQISLVF